MSKHSYKRSYERHNHNHKKMNDNFLMIVIMSVTITMMLLFVVGTRKSEQTNERVSVHFKMASSFEKSLASAVENLSCRYH